VLSFGILVLPKTVLSIWYVFFVDFAITTYKMNSSRHYLACERACHDYEIGVWWKRNDIGASTRSQLRGALCEDWKSAFSYQFFGRKVLRRQRREYRL
jgi:hypothetical protein